MRTSTESDLSWAWGGRKTTMIFNFMYRKDIHDPRAIINQAIIMLRCGSTSLLVHRLVRQRRRNNRNGLRKCVSGPFLRSWPAFLCPISRPITPSQSTGQWPPPASGRPLPVAAPCQWPPPASGHPLPVAAPCQWLAPASGRPLPVATPCLRARAQHHSQRAPRQQVPRRRWRFRWLR
jgi:hypothetical protein